MCRQDGDISRQRRVRNPSKSALPTSLESAESRSYHGMVVNHTKVRLLTRIPSAWCAPFPVHLDARMRAHKIAAVYRRRSIRGRPLYEDESADIHHGPESTTPLKAEYIGADQLSSLIFRSQLCGGPYISGKGVVQLFCLSSSGIIGGRHEYERTGKRLSVVCRNWRCQ